MWDGRVKWWEQKFEYPKDLKVVAEAAAGQGAATGVIRSAPDHPARRPRSRKLSLPKMTRTHGPVSGGRWSSSRASGRESCAGGRHPTSQRCRNGCGEHGPPSRSQMSRTLRHADPRFPGEGSPGASSNNQQQVRLGRGRRRRRETTNASRSPPTACREPTTTLRRLHFAEGAVPQPEPARRSHYAVGPGDAVPRRHESRPAERHTTFPRPAQELRQEPGILPRLRRLPRAVGQPPWPCGC